MPRAVGLSSNISNSAILDRSASASVSRCETWSLVSTLRSHQMHKIFFVPLWQQIMLNLLVTLILLMNRTCRLHALSQTWIVDLGASFHVAPIKECLTTSNASSLPHVYIGNNHSCSVEGIGIVHFIVNCTNDLVLHDVMYVPSNKKCLLSLGQMNMHGYSSLFRKGSCILPKSLG